jgi:hypothetical protein
MSGAVRITRSDLSAAELCKLSKMQTKPLIVRRILGIALVLEGRYGNYGDRITVTVHSTLCPAIPPTSTLPLELAGAGAHNT